MQVLFFFLLIAATSAQMSCPPSRSRGPCVQAVNPNTCPGDGEVCDIETQLCCLNTDMIPSETPVCRDRVNLSTGKSDCGMMIKMCNATSYSAIMHDNCPKTCGFCTPTNSNLTTAPKKCEDKLDANGKNECTEHQSYCTDPAWMQVMKLQCPKTCGFCS